jgi:hypothetical protein
MFMKVDQLIRSCGNVSYKNARPKCVTGYADYMA